MREMPIAERNGLAFRKKLLITAAALQLGCSIVFAVDVFIERSELTAHTWVELLAVIALTIGALFSISQYRQLLLRNSKVNSMLRVGHFKT